MLNNHHHFVIKLFHQNNHKINKTSFSVSRCVFQNGAGFTLIEIMVAIFILTAGTFGAFSLIQKTIAFSSISSSQLVAAYLAQEGIEIIRNIRDTNYLEGAVWDDGISVDTDYRLDYQSSNFPDASCQAASDYLQYDGSFYNCLTGNNSIFKREITVSKPESDRIIVSVDVSWYERGREHHVTAQTDLYNWR